jgi:hypothetical protein
VFAGGALAVTVGVTLLLVRDVFPGGSGTHRRPPPAEAATAPSPSPLAIPAPEPGTRAFARRGALKLYVPVKHLLLIGYHEASLPGALAFRPIGHCARDYNRTRFTCPPPARGPPFLIMSSRGRIDPPTSAVDVAMRPGAIVLSPVTGVVLSVESYRLYGTYPDVEITLGADGSPGLRVLLIHIQRVKVSRGDLVVAGRTPLGRPRRFPFGSQVNDYVGMGIPHVHIEVKRRGT